MAQIVALSYTLCIDCMDNAPIGAQRDTQINARTETRLPTLARFQREYLPYPQENPL